MRGAGRIGGRNFKLPTNKGGGKSFDPFEALDLVGDLPVAPVLTPINDNFSWSIDADLADPRDCSRYPASPYCGEIPFRPGSPVGYDFEIKTNGCETCVYVYPVILWMKLTPQVICYRDPNCDAPPPNNKKDISGRKPPRLNENPQSDKYRSPECARREGVINAHYNWHNDTVERELMETLEGLTNNREYRNINFVFQETPDQKVPAAGLTSEFLSCVYDYSSPFRVGDTNDFVYRTSDDDYYDSVFCYFTYEFLDSSFSWRSATPTRGLSYRIFKAGACCGKPVRPRVTPPPPSGDDSDEDKKRKKGGKMCCNECKDASENTSKLLKEIQAIKKALGTGQFEKAVNAAVGIGDGSVTAIVNLIAKRIGTSTYPVEVPQSLLTGVKDGDNILKVESVTDFIFWLTNQLDALIGEFPIDIEIKDVDPLTAGDQKKTIQLTNIAETLAEIYGLSIKGSVNQEAEQAILLRLAIEAIAIKNGVAITQDYVKANTKFLGYRGNPIDREIEYGFDFSTIDLKSKDQSITLDQILKQSKGYIKGWENEDKDTATGFFQKLMFSAGIIKSVFFRDKKQVKEMAQQAQNMLQDDLDNNKKWKEFVQGINSPNSVYNKGKGEQPEITVETRDPNKPI